MLHSPSNDITASPAAPGEQETGAALPSRKTAARISLHSCVAALMVLDFLVFALAGSLAALGPPEFQLISLNFEDWRVQAIIFAACSHFIWARLFDLYRVKSILRRSHALRRLPLSIIATFCLLLVIAVAGKSAQTHRESGSFDGLGSVSRLFSRFAGPFSSPLRAMKNGACVERALSVGMFCDLIGENEIERHTGSEVRVIERLIHDIADVASLAGWITRGEIDRIDPATPWEHIPMMLHRLHFLRHLSARVYVLPSSPSLGLLIRQGDQSRRTAVIFCALMEPIPGRRPLVQCVEGLSWFRVAGVIAGLRPVALMIRVRKSRADFFPRSLYRVQWPNLRAMEVSLNGTRI